MNMIAFQVWLDIVFTGLYLFVLAFLIFHFVMGIVKGRFHKKYIEGGWPEHDHIPPATPKWIHGIHMAGVLVLALTGMYLRFPFFYGGREFMRNTHYVLMIVVTITLVWRLWYAFFSKTNADWKEFAVGKEDLNSALGVLAYYGYFSNNKPHVAKYNVMQKMSYLLFLGMMVLQIFTGFALVKQGIIFGASPRDILLSWWLGPLVGGPAAALWYARTLHYILNWGFLIMLTVHFYLAANEDLPCTLDFFGIKSMETVDAHGDHDSEPDAGGHDGHDGIPQTVPGAVVEPVG
jgi:Ni/Fe-hydrogenase 1 B-type cytochrome subunit